MCAEFELANTCETCDIQKQQQVAARAASAGRPKVLILVIVLQLSACCFRRFIVRACVCVLCCWLAAIEVLVCQLWLV